MHRKFLSGTMCSVQIDAASLWETKIFNCFWNASSTLSAFHYMKKTRKALGDADLGQATHFHIYCDLHQKLIVQWLKETFNDFVCHCMLLVLYSRVSLGERIAHRGSRLRFRLENQGTWRDQSCLPLMEAVDLQKQTNKKLYAIASTFRWKPLNLGVLIQNILDPDSCFR